MEGHSDWVYSVAFSPDGQYLASASRDNTVKLWHVKSGECTRTMEGHSYWVSSVAFSPDGQYLASCSADKTVKIWYNPIWYDYVEEASRMLHVALNKPYGSYQTDSMIQAVELRYPNIFVEENGVEMVYFIWNKRIKKRPYDDVFKDIYTKANNQLRDLPRLNLRY